MIRAFYYTALVEDQEYSSIRPLVDWLDYNGYSVVTKPTKEFVDSLGRRKVKGNMDIELAVDAMEMADHIDHMVLFSGDGDFRSLVEAIQRKGVRVSVVSTVTTQPPMVADELRRQADEFVDLVQLIGKIGRDPGERSERPQRYQERRPVLHGAFPARRRRRNHRSLTRGSARHGGIPDNPVQVGVDAGHDCPCCPRLVAFRAAARANEPDWHNAPVASFGDPAGRLVIVGLAPGLRGANRTGRPFTGDFAGDLLYETLIALGFATGRYEQRADDGLTLTDCLITNAVRCVPPENKPTPAEIRTCRVFLEATLAAMTNLRAIVALGRIAHDSVVRAIGQTPRGSPSAMAANSFCQAKDRTASLCSTAIIAHATTRTRAC